MVLNYSRFLQASCSLFEESFRVFERAIDMFPWPHKYEIWLEYLKVMVQRFKDSKVERIRELFSKCMQSLPETKSLQNQELSQKGQIDQQGKLFYLLFSDFEEKYGLISHSVSILEKGIENMDDKEVKFELFNLVLAKTTQYFGIMRTRKVFEKAFESLSGPYLI